MEAKPYNAIVVEYYSDPTKMIDDHDSEPVYLTEISERRFENVFDAIKFLSECKNPITSVEDLIPPVKKPKGFKFVLPEQNIKIKHQANSIIDLLFERDDIDWS